MKHISKLTALLAIAIAFTACQFNSLKRHSAYVDSLHFTDAVTSDAADNLHNFVSEELKADSAMDHNSVSDNDALIKKLRQRVLDIQNELNNATSKLQSNANKIPHTPQGQNAPEMQEFLKWQIFLINEGKRLNKVNHKILKF